MRDLIDIYTDNKCGGDPALIGEPGACANVTGTDLSNMGSTRRFNWLKASAPATMSGGIQLVSYSALGGRADTCDDAVPTVAKAVTAWGDKNGAFPGTCRTVTDTVINVTREIMWGCLGYGGRAVWARWKAAVTRVPPRPASTSSTGRAISQWSDPTARPLKLSADDVRFLGIVVSASY